MGRPRLIFLNENGEMVRKCSKCKNVLSLDNFSKQRENYKCICKACAKIQILLWREKNKEKRKKYAYTYYEEYARKKITKPRKTKTEEDFQKERDDRARKNRENRKNITKQRKLRYQKDPKCKIENSLRCRLYGALKAQSVIKTKSVIQLFGCPKDQLIKHLESLWSLGMSWENYGYRGWHVDHIVPCSAFDLSKLEEQEKCFHYSNLQPLWAKENMKKSDSNKPLKILNNSTQSNFITK